MSFWTAFKQKLRSIIPVSRTYMDNKLRELEKENKRQGKILQELQKNTQSLLDLKQYIDQEFERRDDWGKRAAEIRHLAGERPVWVIKCPAPEGEVKVRWGDYAYAVALKRYLDRMDIFTIIDMKEDWNCEENADVVLVLRGCHFYRPDRRNEKCVYVMWNISHPEMVTPEEYQLYDIVCVASLHYAEKLKKELTVPVVPLLQCTDTELFYPVEETEDSRNSDYIFIGNSRGVARRCVMWGAEDKLPLKIWGSGWKAMLGPNKTMVQELFIENSQIPALYRTSKATLNDHWKDMLDHQFVNNRIFDALACGLPVISDYCEELKDIFPDAVLYYSNKEEFDQCVKELDNNYGEIKAKVAAQWPLIKEKYSFEVRARELVEIVGKYKQGEQD